MNGNLYAKIEWEFPCCWTCHRALHVTHPNVFERIYFNGKWIFEYHQMRIVLMTKRQWYTYIIKTVDKPMDHTAYVQSHHSDESQKNTIFSVLFSFYFHCLFFVVCLLVGFMYTNIMKYAFIILIHPSNTHINVNNNIVWTMNVGCLIDFFNLNCFSVVFCLLFSTSHPTTKPFGLNSSQLPDLNIQKCPVISFIYFNIFLFCFTFGMASKVVNMVSVSLYSLLLFWIRFFFSLFYFPCIVLVQLE